MILIAIRWLRHLIAIKITARRPFGPTRLGLYWYYLAYFAVLLYLALFCSFALFSIILLYLALFSIILLFNIVWHYY